MIKGILFDMIGTTVLEQGSSIVAESFLNAFAAHQIRVTNADVNRIRGMNKLDGIERILITHGHEAALAQKILSAFAQNFRANLYGFKEHENLPEIVDALKRSRIKIGIGTGLSRDIFDLILKHLNWQRYGFDFIGITEEIGFGRPNPAMIKTMQTLFGIDSRSFLKVGDTVSDIQEGKNAGVLTAVVLSGTQERKLLIDENPDHILNDLREVLAVVDGYERKS